TLSERSVKALLSWAEEHRLSIKVDLYHEAERAHLEVTNGRVAEVVVDGKSDLGALARVETWRQGDWRVSLKPLLVAEAVPVFLPDGDMTPPPMAVPSASGEEIPPWLALKGSPPPPPESMAWLTPARGTVMPIPEPRLAPPAPPPLPEP